MRTETFFANPFCMLNAIWVVLWEKKTLKIATLCATVCKTQKFSVGLRKCGLFKMHKKQREHVSKLCQYVLFVIAQFEKKTFLESWRRSVFCNVINGFDVFEIIGLFETIKLDTRQLRLIYVTNPRDAHFRRSLKPKDVLRPETAKLKELVCFWLHLGSWINDQCLCNIAQYF